LPETKEFIMAAASSITELLDALEDIKETWLRVRNDKLKKNGESRNHSELTPATLVSIVNALDVHAHALDTLTHTLQNGTRVGRLEVEKKKATLTVELPQEPSKAARGPFDFLRAGPQRKEKNLGVYDMV
jgi:hypothetical protein